MPIYIYQHPKTKKVIEVIQRMTDVHEYTDKKGVKWNRIFEKPNASVDTQINPFSYSEFVNKTNGKKGTIGDLWDLSADLSAKRQKKAGKDEVKEKVIKDYEKKCKGTPHPFKNK